MLSGDPGVSTKRVVTSTAALLIFTVVIVDLFTDKTVTEYIYQGLIWIAMSGLGSIALENFSNINKNKTQSPNKTPAPQV